MGAAEQRSSCCLCRRWIVVVVVRDRRSHAPRADSANSVMVTLTTRKHSGTREMEPRETVLTEIHGKLLRTRLLLLSFPGRSGSGAWLGKVPR